MTNRTARLLPTAISIGVVLLLGTGCAVSPAATAGDAVTIAGGGATDGGSVGTTSSASAHGGTDAGTVGSGTSGGTTAASAAGTHGSGADMDAVAITVLYAGTEPVLTSEFVRPIPNFVFTFGGRVVSSSGDAVVERSVSPALVRDLLDRADELGLLEAGAVPPGDMVPDGPHAKVTLVHQGREVILETQSLLEEESDPTRKALRAFIEESTAVATDASGEKAYHPVSYLFRATPVQQDADAVSAEPWPVDIVSPADAVDCAEITARAWGGEMATDANTYFLDDELLYTVAAIPALPGQSC